MLTFLEAYVTRRRVIFVPEMNRTSAIANISNLLNVECEKVFSVHVYSVQFYIVSKEHEEHSEEKSLLSLIQSEA